MNYFKNIFETIFSVLGSLKIVFKHYFSKQVTIQYPEEKEILPERSRMRLFNDVDNCISCTLCVLACPVQCIYLKSTPKEEGEEILLTDNGMPIKQNLTQYTIDTSLCCYCGLCSSVCPTGSLKHTHDYEFSQVEVKNFKYNYLDPEVKKWKKRLYE